jgi:hypothetical protein
MYHPENFDPPLRIVASLNAYEENYTFDIFLVVQEVETGRVHVGSDSGCSCPIPFEDFRSLGDFTPVRTWNDVKREYDAAFPAGSSRPRTGDIQSIYYRVAEALIRAS